MLNFDMNFFPKIFKQKKTLIFVFLFLLASGILSPQISRADWLDTMAKWNPLSKTGELWCLTPWNSACDFAQKNTQAASANFDSILDATVKAPFAAFCLAIGIAMVSILGTISVLAATLLSWVMSLNVGCYTCMTNPAIALGWPMVRDLANMFVVLGFVVVGIAFTLRIESYGSKKVLINLIIAAILINFSLLICGIFIDGSNITATYFMKSSDVFSRSWGQTLTSQTTQIWDQWSNSKDWTAAAIGVLSAAAGLTFYNIMSIVIFFMYFFLYMFRYISLWILVILSPLAFVCYVFPFTKKFFSMWWSNFFQWCIIIIPISFFLWIANAMVSGLSKTADSSGIPILAFLVPGCFLIIGFLFSLKIGAMGAGAAIGVAKWTGGKMGGAGGAVGSALGRLTGNRAASTGQKISSTTGRIMERLGLQQTGTQATKDAARVENLSKTMGSAYNSEPAAKARIQALAKNGRGADAAAAMKVVAENNDLHSVFKDQNGKADLNAINGRVAYSQSFGADRKAFTKAYPTLEQYNTNKISDIKSKNSGMTDKQAQQEAVSQSVAKLGRADIEKLHPDAIDAHTLTGMSQQQLGWLFERGTPAAQEKARKLATEGTSEGNAVTEHTRELAMEQQKSLTEKIKYIQIQKKPVAPKAVIQEETNTREQKERLKNPSGEAYKVEGERKTTTPLPKKSKEDKSKEEDKYRESI
jgi:hypothetical protein